MKKLLFPALLLACICASVFKVDAQEGNGELLERNKIKAFYLMTTRYGEKFTFEVYHSTNVIGDVLSIELLTSNKWEQVYFIDDSYTLTSMSRLTGGESEVMTTWSSGSGCRTYIFGVRHRKIVKLLYVESKLDPEVVTSSGLHILFSNTYGEFEDKRKWETVIYDEIDGIYKKRGTVPYLKRYNGLE
jgi:hypothetical protein